MGEDEAWERLATAPVMVLATLSPDGFADLVPIVTAVARPVIYFAVDDVKPKRTLALARLQNIGRNPAVTLLAQHYEDDWSRLWWVRARGRATVCSNQTERARALESLTTRHRQYDTSPPPGAVVRIEVGAVLGWKAGPTA